MSQFSLPPSHTTDYKYFPPPPKLRFLFLFFFFILTFYQSPRLKILGDLSYEVDIAQRLLMGHKMASCYFGWVIFDYFHFPYYNWRMNHYYFFSLPYS